MSDDQGSVFVTREGDRVRVEVEHTDWEPGGQGLTYAVLSPDDARKLAVVISRAAAEAEAHNEEQG